jgi:hypothetical protein
MSTALHRNPFHVLGATPRDSGARLLQLADDRALIADPAACQKAFTDLVNPRTRLAAELAWLPGVASDQAMRAIEWLDRSTDSTVSHELPPLARANLAAAKIEHAVAPLAGNDAVRHIVDLAFMLDSIDLQTLLRELNEDRAVAGVPLLPNADGIAAEFETQRRYYKRVVRDMLDKLPTRDMIEVVTEAADRCTGGGTRPAPRLAQDLGDTYELEAQAFVAGETANIERLIARAQAEAMRGDSRLLATIDALSKVSANWTLVMKPMQVLRRGNGIDHPASVAVAARIRNLAIWLTNERRMIEASRRIIDFLRREFNALIELSARLDEDASRIAAISSAPPASGPRAA